MTRPDDRARLPPADARPVGGRSPAADPARRHLPGGRRHRAWPSSRGRSGRPAALLALVVSLALQVGVNYANDYSDGIRGTDAERVGPLRLVGSGLAAPAAVRRAALTSFAVAGLAGLGLVIMTGQWWLLAVGVACVLAAWYYTGGRRPYGYRGLGEVFVFVFFGLVAVGGTAYVQVGRVALGHAADRRWRSARWPARSWWPTTCATSPATPAPASAPWPPGSDRTAPGSSTPGWSGWPRRPIVGVAALTSAWALLGLGGPAAAGPGAAHGAVRRPGRGAGRGAEDHRPGRAGQRRWAWPRAWCWRALFSRVGRAHTLEYMGRYLPIIIVALLMIYCVVEVAQAPRSPSAGCPAGPGPPRDLPAARRRGRLVVPRPAERGVAGQEEDPAGAARPPPTTTPTSSAASNSRYATKGMRAVRRRLKMAKGVATVGDPRSRLETANVPEARSSGRGVDLLGLLGLGHLALERRPDLGLGPVAAPLGVERAVACRSAGRCGRRRSPAAPGSAPPAAARPGCRRSRPARRRTPASGCRSAPPRRPPAARPAGTSPTASAKYWSASSSGRSGVALVRLGDPVQEPGPDDAAAPPDPGHRPAVDVPAVLRAGRRDLVEALGVGDHLGRVQGLPDVLDERVGVLDVPRRRRAPGSTARAASRCGTEPDSARAKVASAIPVIGTPRSSAFCTVQRPVPFCSAWSRIDVDERAAGRRRRSGPAPRR